MHWIGQRLGNGEGIAKALDALDQAVKGKQGERTDLLYNMQKVTPTVAPPGTSADAAIRRLLKDAPVLHSRVLADPLVHGISPRDRSLIASDGPASHHLLGYVPHPRVCDDRRR